jgi:hypothetical protein
MDIGIGSAMNKLKKILLRKKENSCTSEFCSFLIMKLVNTQEMEAIYNKYCMHHLV